MARYVYLKKPVRRQRNLAFIPLLLISFGLLIIGWVAYPIVSFEFFLSPKFATLVRPIPDEVIVQAMENEERILGLEAEDNGGVGEGKISAIEVDYTKASNWFPQQPPQKTFSQEREYALTIPKLGIKDALVVVGGEDLSASLIHYGGTVMPGEWGNTVVFGHSVLPQFFNPKNYKTIFSTLPTLEKKDKILVDFDGLTYFYEVFELKVVPPNDISVLEQKYDSSYLSLVTCVPPGTYWKRLIVIARLKKI